MCGIAGEVSFGGASPSPENVESMCSLLTHRGPDEGGLHVSPRAVLGIRRLKVIGVVNGSQPVYNERGTVACVFNGEVYNYPELKAELERDGYQFRTNTDAEVIVHLYDKAGDSFVERLRGMFAVAIYDAERDRLLLTRDRAGKKPLNYHVTPEGGVVFASELNALTAHPAVSRRVSAEAVDRFLSFRIIPAPFTIYSDVFKVLPGTIVTFERGRRAERRYWAFDFTERTAGAGEGELADRLEELLLEAVEVRLHSEVPLGALLSGGLDSSLIVAMMSRLLGRPIHTFSIGFREHQFNELNYAEMVSAHCDTIHHEYVIPPDSALEDIRRLLVHYGEPYAFPSAIACYHMNRLARRYVTVVLTGDGSDELFCGYNRYKIFEGFPALPTRADWLARVDAEVFARAGGDIAAEYQSVLTDGLRDSLKARLYTRDFVERLPGEFPVNYLRERFAANGSLRGRLDRVLDVDCNFWLRDAQLVKVDIASMANSVEVRCPILDQKVIDFVTGVGMQHKLTGGDEKHLLKLVALRYLPEEIVRRKKQELAVPLESWLAASLRDDITRTLLSDESLSRGYFEPDAVRQFVRDFPAEQSYAVWTLYVLELWHRLNEHGAAEAGEASADCREPALLG
jgi:asparagine synthase (glutamine-hydrolysing)